MREEQSPDAGQTRSGARREGVNGVGYAGESAHRKYAATRAADNGDARGDRTGSAQGGVGPIVVQGEPRREGRQAAWVRGIVPALLVGMLLVTAWRIWRPAPVAPPAPPPLAAPGGVSTRREEIEQFVAQLEARLAANPGDAAAAARLSDALLRLSRVTGNAGLAVRAEQALTAALAREPEHYEALRAMGAVLLSQHRFREAIDAATRAQRIDPADAWHDAVIGDAHLELGEYDAAFAAFDRMMRRRPSAAAYARVSYARELQGDPEGALRLMRMAAEATSASDPEGQAWCYAQVGDLLFQRGALEAARTEYARAAFTFPDHPFAAIGLARVKAAQGDHAGALADYRTLMARAPSPFLAARIAELQARLGRASEATRAYALAEQGWRHDTPEPTLLAALLASRAPSAASGAASGAALSMASGPGIAASGRAKAASAGSPPAPAATSAPTRAPAADVALAAAEQAAALRHDIFTMDALAWARFKAGRLAEAREASAQARRTGTRDRVILYHAAAIAEATGDLTAARTLVSQALAGHASFDLVAAPEAEALRARLTRPADARRS